MAKSKDSIIVTLIIIVTVLVGVTSTIIAAATYKHRYTAKRVEAVANYARVGVAYIAEDAWEHPITLYTSDYDQYVDYTAVSSGRDRTFGTKDDISHTARDYKKTKIAAEWMGKKTKETAKGFWRGLSE